MNGYFKPLRRKVGAVALFLAFICVDAWISSFRGLHEFRIPTAQSSELHVVSMRGDLRIEKIKKMGFYRGTHSEILVKIPYATLTVPLIVLTAFLLFSRPKHPRLNTAAPA